MELLNQLPFKQSVVVKGNVPRERAGEHASVERLAEVAASNVRVINENAKIRKPTRRMSLANQLPTVPIDSNKKPETQKRR